MRISPAALTRCAVALSALALAAVSAAPARAAGHTSCGNPWQHDGRTVYTCDLWPAGPIPVRARPDGNSPQVGQLNEGGWANWFTTQSQGPSFSDHGYSNDWYAHTLADNGHWGYVSEVYFAQGDNYERDARLPVAGRAPTPPPASPPPAPRAKPDQCGTKQPFILRTITAAAFPSVAQPPPGGGGDDSSGLEQIGTVQNCIHRTTTGWVYGRTLLRLRARWDVFNTAYGIKTTLSDGHHRRIGAMSVEDVMDRHGNFHLPDHGSQQHWHLTRAFRKDASGRADNGFGRADRPSGGVFVWDTAPMRFRSSATYAVTSAVKPLTERGFVEDVRPAGIVYGGWAPSQDTTDRHKAMRGLTIKWSSRGLNYR